MPSFSARSRAKLATCHPDLQRLFEAVVHQRDCTVLAGHRGEAAQRAAFTSGRSQLDWPESRHNARPSEAVDVAPYPIDWTDRDRWLRFAGYVEATAHALGIAIRWGGDWDGDGDLHDQRLVDMPHWELVEPRLLVDSGAVV